ncbi:MAG TPA: Holliday junction branch migration protein RuvA [Ginsengibacter sp.]|nr:Holliday junction branch migration protein RuvA [Chitinophagaceae bacterium]MCZ2397432.1 Holliday junction branch migration protein RuvA [Chitinophagales bacterium]HRN73171.1 Holliday junction branch migration protein RuvA [Ginsengibacter sp.]MCO5286132.1 Holliday junction branch migration protein RuvA [Chitinophagaceae bacterium]MCW5915653.1 Holliday junction branch migration protein RuvA [Chitinophagaceae bacterium]
MIAYLIGKFTYKSPATVHVEVHGVGYEVNISLNTYSKIQHLEEGKLLIYYQVKEDAHTLYGFSEAAEKEMFTLLLSVSGVGAATARMMLSGMKPDEITSAIAMNNPRVLESVKGIGKKTAERLILELKDKIGKVSENQAISGTVYNNTLSVDALNALVALGISKPIADQAIKKVTQSDNSITDLEELIKKALKAI